MVPFGQAEKMVSMLVMLGRAVPADQWVPSVARQVASESVAGWLEKFL